MIFIGIEERIAWYHRAGHSHSLSRYHQRGGGQGRQGQEREGLPSARRRIWAQRSHGMSWVCMHVYKYVYLCVCVFVFMIA